MKGIILAAGIGSRVSPASRPISKILLPIYDRPMIYYPLSIIMSAGIKDILIITNEQDNQNFVRTLGDGSQFGISIQYSIQYVQRGIADAFLIAKEFIQNDKVMLVLGDNILYSDNIDKILKKSIEEMKNATIFGYIVSDPKRFGVIEFDENKNVKSLEEKPMKPKSNYAAIGIYLYDENVHDIAKTLTPSKRNELEITDLNIEYLNNNKLKTTLLDEKTVWFDTGTFDSLLNASIFIHDKEKKLNKKILCPEIIAYENGYVSYEKIMNWIDGQKSNEYYGKIKEQIKK